jgi:hypothetical protein
LHRIFFNFLLFKFNNYTCENSAILFGRKPPPSGLGGISANVIWGENMKGEERKGENVK